MGEVQLVDDGGIEPLEFGFVEAGRGTAEGGQVECVDQRGAIGNRLHRQRCAEPRQQGHQRLGLDPGLAQRARAQRSQPFRQLALAPNQQRLMREARRGGVHRGEHLQLHRGVRHVVLAAQHVAHAHLDIVHGAWQHVEP